MPTTNKDFVVKNGLTVQGLTTSGYVTNASGVFGTVATIPNSGLTNSSITINGVSVSLGGSTTISGSSTAGDSDQIILAGQIFG
jgi:hypothetical protein